MGFKPNIFAGQQSGHMNWIWVLHRSKWAHVIIEMYTIADDSLSVYVNFVEDNDPSYTYGIHHLALAMATEGKISYATCSQSAYILISYMVKLAKTSYPDPRGKPKYLSTQFIIGSFVRSWTLLVLTQSFKPCTSIFWFVTWTLILTFSVSYDSASTPLIYTRLLTFATNQYSLQVCYPSLSSHHS